jgi:hypothetical protein
MAERADHFYHGTVEHLSPGDTVLPSSKARKPLNHGIGDPDMAYATKSEDSAWNYASLAHDWHVNRVERGPFPHPRVYEVAPAGAHEEDPNTPGGSDHRSPHGWKVLSERQMPEHMGEPEDWHR